MAKVRIDPPKLSAQQIELYWSHVDKAPGQGPKGTCWQWQGTTIKTGYGKVTVWPRQHTTHRLAFFLSKGYWPTQWVLHECDNPPCCNPDHLFEGTPRDNSQDSTAKGRWPRGERSGVAKLTNDQVREIRAICAKGGRFQRSIAAQFGITQTLVSQIARRKIWKHI